MNLFFYIQFRFIVMDSLSLQGQTLLKTHPIAPFSIAYLQNHKKNLVMIIQPKGIHVYNLDSYKFQEQIKMADRGSFSCITVSDDLIFFACGMGIYAAGANGKVIFQFDTFIAGERIDMVVVSGYRMWVIAGNLINQFLLAGAQLNNKKSRKGASPNQRTQDSHSHVFESKVNGIEVIQEQLQKPFLLILKNSNQIICYDQKQLCSLKTNSPPVALCRYKQNHRFLVGMMSGQIIYIDASRKQIRQLWSLKEGSIGKINSLVRGKNDNFLVFRDECMEIWGPDRTLLGTQEISQKIVCAQFITDKQLVICASSNGNISKMNDYMQMMKDYQARNQVKTKESLEKDINQLKKQLQALKARSQKASSKNKNVKQGISAKVAINIDYTNLCYCLELDSEQKICKVIIKGDLTVLKNPKIVFEGKQDNQSIYVIEEESVNNCKIPFKIEEAYHQNLKMRVIVYGIKNGETFGVNKILDMKPMSLHHKIGKSKLDHHNVLSISGQFKYFQINMWLNSIFMEFGATGQSGDVFEDVFYESLLTKQKVLIQYKNQECNVKAENPAVLIIIRKMLIQKAKQRHISLNFSIELNFESVTNMVSRLAKTVRPMIELKRKSQLLPGLMELRNDETLSNQFKQIISQKNEIELQLKNCLGEFEALLQQIRACFIAYRSLKERQVNKFDIDSLERAMNEFDEKKICALILQ